MVWVPVDICMVTTPRPVGKIRVKTCHIAVLV